MGQLPHGNVGDYHYQALSIEVEKFLEKNSLGIVPPWRIARIEQVMSTRYDS